MRGSTQVAALAPRVLPRSFPPRRGTRVQSSRGLAAPTPTKVRQATPEARRRSAKPRELSSFCFPTCLESTWRARSCPWGAEPAVTGVRRRGESTLRDVAQLRTERLLHHLSGATAQRPRRPARQQDGPPGAAVPSTQCRGLRHPDELRSAAATAPWCTSTSRGQWHSVQTRPAAGGQGATRWSRNCSMSGHRSRRAAGRVPPATTDRRHRMAERSPRWAERRERSAAQSMPTAERLGLSPPSSAHAQASCRPIRRIHCRWGSQLVPSERRPGSTPQTESD